MFITNLYLDDSYVNEVSKKLNFYVSKEIFLVDKPCYKVSYLRYKNDLTYLTKVDKQIVKKFLSQLSPKYRNFTLLKDDLTITMLILILYYLRQKDFQNANLASLFLAIKFYGSLFRRMFPKFCSDEIWRLTLTKISTMHLYRSKKSISGALSHINNEVFDRYKMVLSKNKVDETYFIKYVFELRHRIAQSLKSFAEKYYSLLKDSGSSGISITQDEDEDKKNTSDSEKAKMTDISLATLISTNICSYSVIDNIALQEASEKSGLDIKIGLQLLNYISEPENQEDVYFILLLLLKHIEDFNKICLNAFRLNVIKKLLTDGITIHKYNIREQILNFVYNKIGVYTKTLLRSSNKQVVLNFLAQYFLLYIKNRIC